MDKNGQADCDTSDNQTRDAFQRMMTEKAPLGLYGVDHRTDTIIYHNDAFLRIWGIEELKLQISCGNLKHSDIIRLMAERVNDAPAFTELFHKITTAADYVGFESNIRFVNGHFIKHTTSPVEYQEEQYLGRVYVFEDVTEITRAYEDARKSKTRYKELADMLPQIVFESDLDGNLIFVNKSALQAMGYTEEDYSKGLKALDLVAPEDRERALENIHRVLNIGPSGHEYTCLRKDGTRIPVIIHSSAIYREGMQAGLRGIIFDISERKQAEEKLLLTQASIDNFHDPCTWAGEDGQFLYVNDAACKAFGYSREELLRMKIPDIDVSYKGDRFKEIFAEIKADGGAHIESLIKAKDGRIFPVEISIKAYHYGDKVWVVSFLHDITDRKLIEERLRGSLREKEVLLKEVHHRVKNNLQIISSLLHLQMSGVDQEPIRHILTDSQNRIRSIALVHERTYMSDDLARIDFPEYLQSLANQLMCTYTADAKQVKLTIEGDNIQIGVDQAVPCGLIMNELISNSLKHAFPDSRQGTIRIHLGSDNTNTITIEDDGVGVPANFCWPNTQSMGMQLVAALVEQLDGTIALERSCGARFTINFPVK